MILDKEPGRVFRGGNFKLVPRIACFADRYDGHPTYRYHRLGIRLIELHKETNKMIKMHDQVTNSEWREFQPSHTFRNGNDNKPVVNITYDEAMKYAAWLSNKTGRKFRLPTEEERIKAESTFKADFSNHPLKECPNVGTFGKNAEGVTGLLGMTYDWCLHANDFPKAESAWQDCSPLMKEKNSVDQPKDDSVTSVTTPEPSANPQESLISLLSLIERRNALKVELDALDKYIAAANKELTRIGLKL